MQDCNPIDTPFSRGENLRKEMGPKTLEEKKKKRLMFPTPMLLGV